MNILTEQLWDEIIPIKKENNELDYIITSDNEALIRLINHLKTKNFKSNNRYIVKTYTCKDFLTNEIENNYYILDSISNATSDYYDANHYSEDDMIKYSNLLYLLNELN